MKTHTIAVLLFAGSMIPAAMAAHAHMTFPQKGIICDQYICADGKTGVSDALTGTYLGKHRLIKLQELGSFDRTQFTLEDGIFCDIKAQKCYQDRYFDKDGKHSAVNEAYTQRLFGH